MVGLGLVILFYTAIFAVVIPIAVGRVKTVSLERIYKDPAGVRRQWRWRTPGPMIALIVWYFAPTIMLTGMLIESKIPLIVHPAQAKLIDSAGITAAAQYDTEKRREIAHLDAQLAEAKSETGWLALPPEQLERQHQAALKQIEEKYSDANREKYVTIKRQAEYDKQFSKPAANPNDISVDLTNIFYEFWSFTWLVLAWYVWKEYRKNRTRGGFHGFARWSPWKEVVYEETHRWLIPMWVHYRSTTRNWQLWERLIGQVGLAVLAQPEGDAVCSHTLLLGATGSGKGAAIFSHIMITCKTPVIYQDEKSECPCIDHPKWRNAIRWGCEADGGWPSMAWNPIEECRQDPDPLNAFINLATVLIPDAEGENAWIPKLTRPIVAEMLMSGPWSTLADFADEVRGRLFAEICDAVQMAAGLRGALDGKNVKEYLVTTLFSELEPFRTGWGRPITTAHDFSLDDLLNRGGYILGAETEQARRSPIRLIWAMLLRKIARSAHKRPVTLLMDEAKKAGKIPGFSEYLVTLRNRGVSIWSAWQSTSQIATVYGREEAEAIVDAFGNQVSLLHGISVRDAEALSKASGTWSKKRGGHMNFGLGLSGPHIGATSGGSDESPIPLITPTDILNRSRLLEDRWAIISARGASKQGNLIIARMMPGFEWTRIPKPEQVAAERARINGATYA